MRLEEAGVYFANNTNCAQSVFAPFAKKLGLDVNGALKIATPFGGGIAHTGQICGAVSGGLMAIGLAKGTDANNKANKDACYDLAEIFLNRFRELHCAITCLELLGFDLGDPAQSAKASQEMVFSQLCPKFVRDSSRIVAEILIIQD